MGRSTIEKQLHFARFVSRAFDEQYSFWGRRFGLDPLIGLVPVIGDFIPVVFSGYLVLLGIRMRMPTEAIALMLILAISDFALGFIPIAGDAADFFLKSHKRIYRMIEEFAMRQGGVIEGQIVAS